MEGLFGGIIQGEDLYLFVPSEVCRVVNLELDTELSTSRLVRNQETLCLRRESW